MPLTHFNEETAFLRHVIAYDNSAERRKLDAQIAQAHRDERCVRRAAGLMALLALLALVGLAYAAVLLPNSLDVSRFFSHFVVKAFSALGLAALGCLMVFLALEAVYRRRLGDRRKECRRLAAKVIETRLGRPQSNWAESSLMSSASEYSQPAVLGFPRRSNADVGS